MNWFTKAMAALLALVWLPVVNHCDLEQLTGLELLACHGTSDSAPHQGNDCETDSCAVVESGHYKIEDQSTSVPVQILAPGFLLASASSEQIAAALPPAQRPATAHSQPGLSQDWQFTLRAAPAPRAPSAFA